ncbi:MAG: hypothetical protein EZS28_055321, partial [Streblomastix strix]
PVEIYVSYTEDFGFALDLYPLTEVILQDFSYAAISAILGVTLTSTNFPFPSSVSLEVVKYEDLHRYGPIVDLYFLSLSSTDYDLFIPGLEAQGYEYYEEDGYTYFVKLLSETQELYALVYESEEGTLILELMVQEPAHEYVGEYDITMINEWFGINLTTAQLPKPPASDVELYLNDDEYGLWGMLTSEQLGLSAVTTYGNLLIA